jgi:hypothetical protein
MVIPLNNGSFVVIVHVAGCTTAGFTLSTEIVCFISSLFCAIVTQVIEFVQFKDRLQRSMQYLAVKSDSVILSLKQNSESLEKVEVSCYFCISSIKWG